MSERDEQDKPEVEGHAFVKGPEVGHNQAVESEDDSPDVEGHMKNKARPQARVQKKNV